jgi:hypothetical protein
MQECCPASCGSGGDCVLPDRCTNCAGPPFPYFLHGCSQIQCTRPSNSAYNFDSVQETSVFGGSAFSVTSLLCNAASHAGVAVATSCSVSGDYTVVGQRWWWWWSTLLSHHVCASVHLITPCCVVMIVYGRAVAKWPRASSPTSLAMTCLRLPSRMISVRSLYGTPNVPIISLGCPLRSAARTAQLHPRSP